jgi:hypothetical protein
MSEDATHLLRMVVDPVWYLARNRDVAASGVDPFRHFIDQGLRERRDPNRWFDGRWYTNQYADVAASGTHPLLHYLSEGAALGRDPHPRFDAGWYADQHPEAAGNPLLFHLQAGASRGWLTERPVAIEDYLPSTRTPCVAPEVTVDVIVPVYRDLALTRRCMQSVLADVDRPGGRIIVVDDCSPEPKLSAWLDRLAKSGAIVLLRNKKNLGFVASVNRGMRHAGDRDVALLNSDTEVPPGLAAPVTGTGVCGGEDRQRFAAVQQRDDLQLSGVRGRPDPARHDVDATRRRVPIGQRRTVRGRPDHGRVLHVHSPRRAG